MKFILNILLILSLVSCNTKQKEPKNKKNQIIEETLIIDKLIEKSLIIDIEDYYTENYGKELKLVKTDTESIIKLQYFVSNSEGNSGIPQMSISIPKNKSSVLYGDLNNDNLEDVIITVPTEGGGAGGNVWWDDIFIFRKNGENYELAISKSNREISGCERGYISIEKIENNIIHGVSLCYEKTDASCCPSLEYSTQLELVKNSIILKSRNAIKNEKNNQNEKIGQVIRVKAKIISVEEELIMPSDYLTNAMTVLTGNNKTLVFLDMDGFDKLVNKEVFIEYKLIPGSKLLVCSDCSSYSKKIKLWDITATTTEIEFKELKLNKYKEDQYVIPASVFEMIDKEGGKYMFNSNDNDMISDRVKMKNSFLKYGVVTKMQPELLNKKELEKLLK